ncbi:hypothetical protein STEG23_016864 [Scotinomys teguina]
MARKAGQGEEEEVAQGQEAGERDASPPGGEDVELAVALGEPLICKESYACECISPAEAKDPTGAEVTGVCEPPDVSVGNQTQVLWKSSTHCALTSHLSSPYL